MIRTLCLVGLSLTLPIPVAAQVVSGRGGMPPPARGAAEVKPVAGTAVIKGRVLDAATGRPLRRAQVRVSAPEGKAAQQPPAIGTDLDGYFEVTELPAGRYAIRVTRAGYLPQQNGQRHPDERGSPLQLRDGQELTVDFALQRAGRLVGRVTDELGEPVAAILVNVLRREYYQGRRQLVPASPGGRTDASGVFRISGVHPGTYYLMASSGETWASEEDPEIVYGHAASYYPGIQLAMGAQQIVVGPGQVVEGLDFSLVPVRTVTVSGMAVAPDGLPLAGASVSLIRELRGPTAASMMTLGQSPVAVDGSWTLRNVPPGEFTLRISGRSAAGGQHSGHLALTVGESDVEGVLLMSDPGAVVAGEVVLEHGAPLPAWLLRVMTLPTEGIGTATFLAPGADSGFVDERGRFSRRGASGPVLVSVIGLPQGWSIKSVEAGGEDFATTPLTLGRGERREGLRIVLTDKFPTLTGSVTDERGNPVEATVLLFPTDEAQWFESQAPRRTTRPDQAGLYRFTSVRPGEYLAIALETLQPGQTRDPEFLDSLRGRAETVRLREGENQTLNLRVER